MQKTKTQLLIDLNDPNTGINVDAIPLHITNHNNFLTDFSDSVFFLLDNTTDDIIEGSNKFLTSNNQEISGIKTIKSLLKTESGIELKEFSSDSFSTTLIGNSTLTSNVRLKLPSDLPSSGEVIRVQSFIGGIAQLEYTSIGVGTVNTGTANRLAIHSGATTVDDSGIGTSNGTIVVLPSETNKTFNIPSIGVESSVDFVLNKTNQSISGEKTFTDNTILNGASISNGTSSVNLTSLVGTDYSLVFPTTQGASNSLVSNDNGNLEYITVSAPGVGDNNGFEVDSSNIKLHYGNATQPGILSVTSQIIAGEKTFNDDLRIEETKKLILKNNSFELSLSSPTLSANLNYTLPLDGTAGQFLKTDGAGNLSFETLNTNIVEDGTQFQIPLYKTANSLNSSVTVGSGLVNIDVKTQAGARTYSFPDVGASADLLLTEGNQTINGVKTHTDSLVSSKSTNQLVLGNAIINSGLISSRTYSLPDAGVDADIVLNQGNSTIFGQKTFNDVLNLESNISAGIAGISLGVNNGQKISFYGNAPIAQQTGLTPDLSLLSQAGAFTPDYNIQTLTNTSPFGFATLDEAETVLSVLINVQTRLNELESKITSLGLIA